MTWAAGEKIKFQNGNLPGVAPGLAGGQSANATRRGADGPSTLSALAGLTACR